MTGEPKPPNFSDLPKSTHEISTGTGSTFQLPSGQEVYLEQHEGDYITLTWPTQLSLTEVFTRGRSLLGIDNQKVVIYRDSEEAAEVDMEKLDQVLDDEDLYVARLDDELPGDMPYGLVRQRTLRGEVNDIEVGVCAPGNRFTDLNIEELFVQLGSPEVSTVSGELSQGVAADINSYQIFSRLHRTT